MKAFNTLLNRWRAASAALILVHSCYALDPDSALSQYSHKHWGADNGFPRGRVGGITQSADGYLWIGTEQGLLRFDGETFTFVRDPSPNPLALEHVLGLSSDREGSLWIRLPSPSVLRFQNAAFATVRLNPLHDPQVTATARGQHGSILFASQQDGVLQWTGTQFEQLIARATLPISLFTSIAETENEDVWLGTIDSGLLRLRGKLVTPIVAGLPSLKINCLLAGAKGELYIGTDRGLVRWDGSKLTEASVPDFLSTIPFLAMVRDHDAHIWVGTSKGLLRLDAQGSSSFVGANSARAITALFEDREGDLWAGSSDELERIQESAFTTYRSKDHSHWENGGPVHADSYGRIWTASVSGGLRYLRGGEVKEFASAGLDRDEVYSIAGRLTIYGWVVNREG